MKLFIVSHWEPFPSSEYGGMQVIFAEDAEACVRIIMASSDVKQWLAGDASTSTYREIKALSTPEALETEVRKLVGEAQVYNLADAVSGIVAEYRT